MSDKKVVMGCSNYWTSSFQVGSHHLARGFAAAGYNVAFMSDPISPLHHWQNNHDLQQRLAIYRTGGQYDMEKKVWYYVPGTLLTPHNKPLLRSDWVHRHWHRLCWPPLLRELKQSGFGEADIIYLDSLYYAFLPTLLTHRKSVLRIADKSSGFPKFTAATARLERKLAAEVDVVVYTARSLEPYVASMRPRRMAYVPNGVNFAHFANFTGAVPPDLQKIPRPIAIYVGALSEWFDFALVNQAAQALPHVSFVLIGPDKLARTHIRSMPNLHLLGPRDYSDIPAYLHHADIGIIPFNVASHPDLVHSIHPLKMYEYMACGLPVVAVAWQELKNLDSPAILCESHELFISNIAQAVERNHQREAYVSYAARHDWTSRIKIFLDILG